jgi:hypothetical protein
MKRHMCNICRNGWPITRGTQPERRVLPLESRSYNKSHPSPKLTASLWLRIKSLSSFVSNPCLTFLNSTCLSFTPNQVYSLVRVYLEPYRWGFTSASLPPLHSNSTLVSANPTQYPTCCPFTSKPWCSDFARDFVNPSYSAIQKEIIVDHANVQLSLEVLTLMEDVVLNIGIWESSFPSRAFDQVMDQEDRVMKRNTSRIMKHHSILQGETSPMHRRKSCMSNREVLLLSTVPISSVQYIIHRFLCSPSLRKSRDEISCKRRGL